MWLLKYFIYLVQPHVNNVLEHLLKATTVNGHGFICTFCFCKLFLSICVIIDYGIWFYETPTRQRSQECLSVSEPHRYNSSSYLLY